MSEQDTQEMQEIELSIEAAKRKIELADKLERLYQNRDFQDLIAKGFLKDYAVKMVHLRAHPNADERVVKRCDSKIDAIGILNGWFQAIFTEGHEADIAMGQAEASREEFLAEEAVSAEQEA